MESCVRTKRVHANRRTGTQIKAKQSKRSFQNSSTYVRKNANKKPPNILVDYYKTWIFFKILWQIPLMLLSNLPSAVSSAQLTSNSDVQIYRYLYAVLHFKRLRWVFMAFRLCFLVFIALQVPENGTFLQFFNSHGFGSCSSSLTPWEQLGNLLLVCSWHVSDPQNGKMQ